MASGPRGQRSVRLTGSADAVDQGGRLDEVRVVRAVVAAAHPVVRSVIDLACREVGITEITKPETAQATVDVCRSEVPDLLVLDLELPDADGLRVLSELGDTHRPPAVLVLSDQTEGDMVLRALRLGASGYVTKAEGLRGLPITIRRVLSGERVIAAGLEQDAVLALGRLARRAREGSEVAAELTSREREVLELLSDGYTLRRIATRLGISPRTVETHVAKIYRKLGVRTRVQAVSRAATLGLVEL